MAWRLLNKPVRARITEKEVPPSCLLVYEHCRANKNLLKYYLHKVKIIQKGCFNQFTVR